MPPRSWEFIETVHIALNPHLLIVQTSRQCLIEWIDSSLRRTNSAKPN
jgi:hypothetical protein